MAARRMEQDRRNEDFRGMLARMEREGHLRRVTKTISPRHITALCGQAPTAVLCEAVDGYDIPVAGGLYWTRDRLASALGWPVGEEKVPPDFSKSRDLFSAFTALQDPIVPKVDEPVSLKLTWPVDAKVKSLKVQIQTDLQPVAAATAGTYATFRDALLAHDWPSGIGPTVQTVAGEVAEQGEFFAGLSRAESFELFMAQLQDPPDQENSSAALRSELGLERSAPADQLCAVPA